VANNPGLPPAVAAAAAVEVTALPLPLVQKMFDVYLMHEWGMNDSVHRCVAKIAAILEAHGISVWLDAMADRTPKNLHPAKGNLYMQMNNGINNSHICLLFLNSRYRNKANSGNSRLFVRHELEHAYARKTEVGDLRLHPVVLEEDLLDHDTWRQGGVDELLWDALVDSNMHTNLVGIEALDVDSDAFESKLHGPGGIIDNIIMIREAVLANQT